MKKYFILIILITIVITNSVFSQQKNVKFDMKYQILSNDFLIIGDFENHKIGKAAGSGAAMLKDGSSAEVKIFFIYDYVNGNGDFTEYYILTFQDNSQLTLQAKGQSMGSTNGSDPLFSAKVIITGGTGIYLGAQGEGSMTGNRADALTSGVVVKLSFDIMLK